MSNLNVFINFKRGKKSVINEKLIEKIAREQALAEGYDVSPRKVKSIIYDVDSVMGWFKVIFSSDGSVEDYTKGTYQIVKLKEVFERSIGITKQTVDTDIILVGGKK
jgi:hypothetical protein